MDFINGFDATVLVYGQTGSGKTYTMFGPPDALGWGENSQIPKILNDDMSYNAFVKRGSGGL